jgi:cysteine desulfurase
MNEHDQPVYLDHSATTPVDPRVVAAMAPFWTEVYGNTESSHSFGQAAASALEKARQQVADVLGCQAAEVVFTASGTEADNLALRGAASAAAKGGGTGHLVVSSIEHPAVGQTAEQLSTLMGMDVTTVGVDEYGRVDADAVADAIGPHTALVSVMLANNEVGTIQPIAQIAAVCRERGVPLHTDAVQAAGRMPLDVDELGVDLLALSGHKFYGPKGVGILYVRRDTPILPALTGGGHERGRRAGTVNVAGAVGLATALRLAEEQRTEESSRLAGLRERLIGAVLERIPDSRLTGHPTERLPHHASFCFRYVEGESLVLNLDLAGIAASSGAACAEGDPESSFVLRAMGLPPDWGIGSLRLTLGRDNDEGDLDRLLEVLPPIVERLRAAA